jgi:hypothetical protein
MNGANCTWFRVAKNRSDAEATRTSAKDIIPEDTYTVQPLSAKSKNNKVLHKPFRTEALRDKAVTTNATRPGPRSALGRAEDLPLTQACLPLWAKCYVRELNCRLRSGS